MIKNLQAFDAWFAKTYETHGAAKKSVIVIAVLIAVVAVVVSAAVALHFLFGWSFATVAGWIVALLGMPYAFTEALKSNTFSALFGYILMLLGLALLIVELLSH